MNYIKNKFIKELSDPETGEMKYFKEVEGFSRTAAKGWKMTYTSYLEEVLCELNGKKKTQILFWIFDQFKKNKEEVYLNQDKIANIFETSQPYVSKVIKELTHMNVVLKTRKINGKNWYRLNPYLYIPSYANAVKLQDEWDILTHTPDKIKDKFEYLYYLQGEEWKELSNRLKNSKGECEKCGSKDNLECHHLTYERIYKEHEEDLIVLCSKCHKIEHEQTN